MLQLLAIVMADLPDLRTMVVVAGILVDHRPIAGPSVVGVCHGEETRDAGVRSLPLLGRGVGRCPIRMGFGNPLAAGVGRPC
ncbi:hypothetical protein ACLOJK_024182 [Asimina triloba]